MRLPRATLARLPIPSPGELLFGEQLRQAGISFTREHRVTPERKFRADFYIEPDILVEIEGGTWIAGRHSQGKGFADGCVKQFLAVLRGYRYIRVPTELVDDGTALTWIQSLLERRAA